MITINQYIRTIESFFLQHHQINTVKCSDEFDFNADSKIVYPVAHCEYITQNINGNSIAHQFEIIIADLFDPKINDAALEIYNDCNLIATDFIDWFANQTDDFEINENITVQKFTDGNVDKVGGCVFVATFTQFREANKCIIPIEANTTDPVSPDAPKMFYGVISHLPTWSDLVTLNSTNEMTVLLNTGANKMFAVAVLNDFSIVSINDISASDLLLNQVYQPMGQLTDSYVIYDLYVMQQAINYSENHIHRITIK
ncbi:hypothetical protein FPZ42_07630 [Mucilaginibacter achroorhodeus]|uniref:Uncharacterized protein n=1 Tax=Mucilaginibacter achroorhodeus TaxID=2599294 RepID=A0A563U6B4_9SPHI|nr:hypothetical protein [Mucilaginibacter achroorhodeus]TWR26896.1 hypothetical protein FPZ42_07630 [Mucilaginibacter achroorhodeus]